MNLRSFSELNDFVRHGLRNAETLIHKGELRTAAETLNALHRQAPGDWRIHLIAIQLAEAAGNRPAARESAERAVTMAPEAATALIEWARVLSRDGEHEAALEAAKKAAAKVNDDDELVLSRAVAVANAAGDWAFAQATLRRALSARPGDANVLRALAYNAINRRAFEEAVDWCEQVLAQLPEDELALSFRAWVRLEQGELTAAAQDYERLLALRPDHEEYRYYLALARGETPPAQPKSITERIVEGYASQFDELVVQQLGYYAPRRAAELIHEAWPAKNASVLDLGCGSGLLGLYLGPIQGSLVGVDFSQTMLDQAKTRGYDRLHKCDLRDALRDTPPEQYEVIAALDVFVYVGALEPCMGDIVRILRPQGMVVLTFERSDGPPLELRRTGRFAHAIEDVTHKLEAAGLTEVRIEELTLRYEAGAPIAGFIATARKPRIQ
ncbi:MAG: methyltransferase domain-containing protein [Casimicrobiaceae bacterium]